MKTWLVALIVIAAASPAAAQDVLQCDDTGVAGFKWEQGSAAPPRRTDFQPQRFTVQLVSMERRVIKWQTLNEPWDYDCVRGPGRALMCTATALPGLNPIIFDGDRFERVSNYAAHVGGDPDLYVAYGSCARP